MPGITIEEFGFTFILEALEAYWGDALLFFLLFLAAVLSMLLFRRKDGSGIFVCVFFCFLFTIYNPILVRFLVQLLDMETVYYRLFWLLPVTIVLAWYAVHLCSLPRYRWARILLAAGCAALILLGGQPLESVWHPALPDNIYKVSDDLVDACSIIHRDSEEEQPTVVFDTNMNMVARQYDPSLLLALDRNAVLYRAGSQTISEINEDSVYYRGQKALMDVAFYGEEIPMRQFLAGLRWREVDYLVVPLNNPLHSYIQEAGCVPVGETEKYVVYRYEQA